MADLAEINPHLALWQSENYVSPGEQAWERWLNKAEGILGFELDGNQETDGYSLDDAYGAFETDVTPAEYADEVRANIKALGKPIPEF